MNREGTKFEDKCMFRITRKWLQTDVPMVEDWFDLIHNKIIYISIYDGEVVFLFPTGTRQI